MLIWAVLGLAAFIPFLIFSTSVFIGVPPLPAHLAQAKKMVELAKLTRGMKAVDLGSGTGRLLFLAAQSGANVVGYELNPFLVLWTKLLIKLKGLTGQVEVRWKSIYKADLENVNVVFAFLFPQPMKILGPKLFSELPDNAKIFSYVFQIPGHTSDRVVEGIYCYTKL